MVFKIPGGEEKGVSITEASAGRIKFWMDKITKSLAENPNKDFAQQDRAWLVAANAEMKRRGPSGQPAAAPAPAAPEPSAALALATRGLDKLAGSYNDPGAVREALRVSSMEANLVAPATDCGTLPPGCDVAVSLVWVNSDTSKDGPKAVYPVGGGDDDDASSTQVGLAKATLDQIFGAAGISWDSRKSARLDDASDPYYCVVQVVGKVKNFDGIEREIFGTKEMDLREGSPQLEALWDRYKAKLAKFEAGTLKWAPKKPTGQIREMRLHILGHAETKARLRAGRTIGIKTSYSKAELKKPFAVARLMWTGRSEDPELRRIFAEKTADMMLGAHASLYGPVGRPPETIHAERALPTPLAQAPQLRRPPPVGSVVEPLEDDIEEDWDTGGEDEPAQAASKAADAKVGEPKPDAESKAQAPASTSAKASPQPRLAGLPPDQDRGADPNKY